MAKFALCAIFSTKISLIDAYECAKVAKAYVNDETILTPKANMDSITCTGAMCEYYECCDIKENTCTHIGHYSLYESDGTLKTNLAAYAFQKRGCPEGKYYVVEYGNKAATDDNYGTVCCQTPTAAPTPAPTEAPATPAPTEAPATPAPTEAPATPAPTEAPATPAPTEAPATPAPTEAPATPAPTAPTAAPTPAPTAAPTPQMCKDWEPEGQMAEMLKGVTVSTASTGDHVKIGLLSMFFVAIAALMQLA